MVSSEGPSVALAKLLSGCLWIRGAQLSVVRRLDSQHIINIHTTLLTWIGKRLALYEANKNKKSRNTAVLFFKVLHPLVAPVQSRDALKMCVPSRICCQCPRPLTLSVIFDLAKRIWIRSWIRPRSRLPPPRRCGSHSERTKNALPT